MREEEGRRNIPIRLCRKIAHGIEACAHSSHLFFYSLSSLCPSPAAPLSALAPHCTGLSLPSHPPTTRAAALAPPPSLMFPLTPLALLRVGMTALLLCVVVPAVPVATAVRSGSCTFLSSSPSYTFIGGGFHMQLAIEFPLSAKDVRFSFDLPKSFFIDEAETKQLYRMEVLSAHPMTQGTAAVVMEDITSAYTPLHMSSEHFFDIEAPVFKVNYTTNHVELTFQQMGNDGGGSALDAYLSVGGAKAPASFRARLVIPIHSRYDTLDTTTPFSLVRLLTGENSYVRRCLPKVDMAVRADPRCSSETYSSSATPATAMMDSQYKPCLDLPVGQLGDLPFVYHALMGLLVAGAAMVILIIR